MNPVSDRTACSRIPGRRRISRTLPAMRMVAYANNFSTSTSFFNRVDSFIGKIDHNFNPNNMLTGRYYFGDSTQSFPFRSVSWRTAAWL